MIAVTGAAGYIGRATVAQLARIGKVVAIARSAPGGPLPASVQWRITGGAGCAPNDFSGCDAVVHLAGRAHTKAALENGQDLFDRDNRQLALQTAAGAQLAGVRRFVFVSTIGVHGNWSPVTLRSNSPVQPDTPYVRSKWAAEQELAVLCAEHGMELCIVRPPMVYGPDCPGNFRRLLRLVASGLPLPFASISAVRSFVQVDNLASFLAACATRPLGPQPVFVVADGSDWSLAQLVRDISLGLGRRPRYFPFPPSVLRWLARIAGRGREIDSMTRPMRIDAADAWSALQWQPSVNPTEGLRQAVAAHPG